MRPRAAAARVRSGASRRSGGSCASCCQDAAGSVCVRSSTPTASTTPGLDTYDANLALGYSEDDRDYTVAAQMLGALGLDRVALLSNNPDKAAQLDRLGVTVA